MNKLFNNILVPLHSYKNFYNRIKRAVEIANQFQCNIYILSIVPDGWYSFFKKAIFAKDQDMWLDIHFELLEEQRKIMRQLYPKTCIDYAVKKASQWNEINGYCLRNDIDLLLFFEEDKWRWEYIRFKKYIAQIARQASAPVLTVGVQQGLTGIDNIILPIENDFFTKNLMVASYIGKICNSKIHLVSLKRQVLPQQDSESFCLYKAYQLLLANTNLHIKCVLLDEQNMEEAIFKYGQMINADLILFNSETKPSFKGISNWLNLAISHQRAGLSTLSV